MTNFTLVANMSENNFKETKVEALDWLARLFIKRQLLKDAYETLSEVTKLSPKNYQRQKALANLASINNDKDETVKIYARLLLAARYSIHDTPENFLNYARAIIEQAKDANKLEQSRLLGLEPAVQALGVLSGLVVVLELLGPVVTQRALLAARETHVTQESI